MAQNTHGHSSPPSYIDGISVKISERYKPPKRITLALSYSQRLTLNKLIQEPIPSYDFTLEESIKNRVAEWRKLRGSNVEDRKQRLQTLKTKPDKEVLNQSNANDSDNTNISSDNNKEADVSHTYYSTESGVLIPMAVGPQSQPILYQKGFNFSEFESDTSSPFDNMELKTINDLEELAEVLKRDTSQTTQTKKENHINGYYYNSPFTSKINYELTSNQARESSIRSVSEIMKSLEEGLATNHISETLPFLPLKAKPEKTKTEQLENPFNNLSSELQDLAKTISSMGFPLARVARACEALEGNQKKIVEHLLAMSDLLDLGFPEEKVVSALLKCNNDRDKALDLLIT